MSDAGELHDSEIDEWAEVDEQDDIDAAGAPTPEPPMSAEAVQEPPADFQGDDADDAEQGAWGVGWGTGGWGALGSISQAVGAAVKDVADLGTSFGQVLQEMAEEADASDEEQPQQEAGVELVGPPGDPRVEQAIARLQGPPSQLEASFKVIDEGVDSLTTGALTSLGTLFARVGQAAGVAAKELRDTVEGGVMDIGNLPLVQAASSHIAAAPTTAGSLMQRLGQSVAALDGAMAATRLEDAPPCAPLPFEEAFGVYGGAACLDELESLSNECARTVNRTRAQLAADAAAIERRQRLEELSAALPAVFDLQTPHASDSSASPLSTDGALAAGHGIIAELQEGGLQRAQSLETRTKEQTHALAATTTAAAAAGDADTAAAQVQEASGKGRACVLAVQQDASRRVAELTSVCIERLLALARSLVAQARYGKPADDGIQWPIGGEAKAVALRQQARRMASELDVLVQGYGRLLRSACEGVQGALEGGGDRVVATLARTGSAEGEELGALCTRLEAMHASGGDAARGKLWDGTRALLYVALVAGMHDD